MTPPPSAGPWRPSGDRPPFLNLFLSRKEGKRGASPWKFAKKGGSKILSLAACGGQGDKNQSANGSGANGAVTNGSGTNGSGTVNGGITNGSTSSDNGTTANNSASNDARSRSSLGNDVRRGLDDVGDAVEDIWDDGRDAVNDMTRGTANTTSFQRMLNNARVTDVDGTMDGSGSGRW